MNLSSLVRWLVCSTAASAAGVGCLGGGEGVPPSSASAEAHAIADEANAARGNLRACAQRVDAGACDQLDMALCDVIGRAIELEGLAASAGFQSTVPITSCPSKRDQP